MFPCLVRWFAFYSCFIIVFSLASSLCWSLSFSPSPCPPSLFKCSPFNLCGKLGLAIAWKRGIIVPCEPRGQNAGEEEQGGNKQFLCVFCWTVMQKGSVRGWEQRWKRLTSPPAQGWSKLKLWCRHWHEITWPFINLIDCLFHEPDTDMKQKQTCC